MKLGPRPTGPVSQPLTGSLHHRGSNFVARGRSHPYETPGCFFIPTRLPSTVGPPEETQRLLVLAWLLQRDLQCDPCDPIGTLAVDGLATAEKAVNLRVVVGVWNEEGPLAVALLGGISCARTRALRYITPCSSLCFHQPPSVLFEKFILHTHARTHTNSRNCAHLHRRPEMCNPARLQPASTPAALAGELPLAPTSQPRNHEAGTRQVHLGRPAAIPCG